MDKAKSNKKIDGDGEDDQWTDKKGKDRGRDRRDEAKTNKKQMKMMRMTSERTRWQRMEGEMEGIRKK